MLLQIKKYIFYLRAATIIIILSGSYCFVNDALAQGRLVTGKVTDAQTGEPVPYVTISVKLNNGTRRGTVTDFDGLYHIQVPQSIATDSIYCTYIGYIPSQKKLTSGTNPEINFQLATNSKMLSAVNITPKAYVNPAWDIMANMVIHKPDNDLQKLKSYQYQSYNRIELSLSNLSENMKKRRIFQQILPIMDSLKKTAGDDGTPTLPIFMSETISDYYYQNDPNRKTEHVERTRASGVGIEDETLISQLVGTTFLQYDFYSNYLKLAGKDYIAINR